MRIVAHNGAPLFGGAERATVRLLRGLAGRGHEVLLLCNRDVVREPAERAGVPAALQRLGGDVMVPDALRMAMRLRSARPDALLLTTFRKLWLGALAARLARVPRVVARVGLETDTPRTFKYRFVLDRWVDAVVLNAASMRERFEADLTGDGPPVVTIPTGIRMPDPPTEHGALRRSLGIPEGGPVVGTVARLADQKRIDRLLRVTRRLPEPVHLVVAGDGPEGHGLRELAGKLGLGGRVHWLGHREDVGTVLDALDVFVVTSDREGLSNAMLEALWAGVPVVSTPVSGAAEALEGPDPPGRVVDFEEEGIARAVVELLDDSGLRARASAAARRRAEERFDAERMLDAWEGVLGVATAGG